MLLYSLSMYHICDNERSYILQMAQNSQLTMYNYIVTMQVHELL